jgi:hypothetical protein
MDSTKGRSSAQASGNMTPEQYDLVIIGSGTGAKLSAWTFASRGQGLHSLFITTPALSSGIGDERTAVLQDA